MNTTDTSRSTPASRNASHAPVLVRELTSADLDRMLRHFKALGEEDRLLRFGQVVSDHIIEGYVAGIDFSRDTVFGVFDDNLALVGVGHLALLPQMRGDDPQGQVAEFGVSVLEGARGRGIGSHLFERAAISGRNQGVRTLYMHCLSRNATMMHIAKKAGMDINYAYGEADAYLTLPPSDPSTVMHEILQEQAAVFDYAVKRQLRDARRLLGALLPYRHAA